ncbi:MAG: LacI family transcriptional regulator [Firmicutes bacterium]|nr:LacI family transcriptional regulator [Bacillota bacterium]
MNKVSKASPASRRHAPSVTIHDVAREANVSIATVSRALNGSDAVVDATLKKVNAALAKLNYVPHSGARSLVKRETRTMGVLLPDMFGEFFSEVIRGIDQVARQRQYSLLVTSTHGDSHSAEAMLKALHGKVDGLIVLASDVEMYRAVKQRLSHTPVIFLNHLMGADSEAFDTVSVDNFGGALMMTRYLMGFGHRRIAFIKGPEGNGDAEERLMGYRKAMTHLSETTTADLEYPGDFSEAAGFEATRLILRHAPRPTAIFAANDTMAIGVYRALREHGLRIPNDVSVVGFDDLPFVRYLDPPLTSIHAPISELGSSAARRLLSRLESPEPPVPHQEFMEVLMVARASVGTPFDASEAINPITDPETPTPRAPPNPEKTAAVPTASSPSSPSPSRRKKP